MVAYITGAIVIGVILLCGCVGEIITEKAGNLNLGIPGIMCMGAAGGWFGLSLYIKSLTNAGLKASNAQEFMVILIPIIFCFLFAALGGLIYAFLTVTLRANQNVTGLALTTFGGGFAQFIINKLGKFSGGVALRKINNLFPFYSKDSGWFMQIFFSHEFIVYFAIIIAIVVAIVLRKTKVGLNLRAVGENPATADAVGINVAKYKYFAIIIGSAIAGLGGWAYVCNQNLFSQYIDVERFGWLAIALVIFVTWKPDLGILGSILFGFFYLAATWLPSLIEGMNRDVGILLKLLPYVVTVVVLIVTSILDSKENQPPASLGVNYFREDR